MHNPAFERINDTSLGEREIEKALKAPAERTRQCNGPSTCYWIGNRKSEGVARCIIRMEYGEYTEMCNQIAVKLSDNPEEPPDRSDVSLIEKALHSWAKEHCPD